MLTKWRVNYLKKFYVTEFLAQCYKTFYSCNLRLFVTCQDFVPSMPFQPSLVGWQGAHPRVENLRGLSFTWLGSSPSQTLEYAGKACEDKHSSLLQSFVKHVCKKFCFLRHGYPGPWQAFSV